MFYSYGSHWRRVKGRFLAPEPLNRRYISRLVRQAVPNCSPILSLKAGGYTAKHVARVGGRKIEKKPEGRKIEKRNTRFTAMAATGGGEKGGFLLLNLLTGGTLVASYDKQYQTVAQFFR